MVQSASNSSATSCASPVSVPWPISERAIRTVVLSSGPITTHRPIAGPDWAASKPRRTDCANAASGTRQPSAKAPAAAETRKRRRFMWPMSRPYALPLDAVWIAARIRP